METAAAAIEIVPASTYHPTTTTWPLKCEHTAEELNKRIPLDQLQAVSPNPLETPFLLPQNYRTTRACFEGTSCFRAVRDDFVSLEEAQLLWQGLVPNYGREKSKSPQNGELYMGIQENYFPAGLLNNITSRMKFFLESEMGARGVKVSHTNSRGEWRFLKGNATAGHESAARRQKELLEGRFTRRHGHVDSARPTNWHYTCLLYVGEHDPDKFAGGETLLIDEVSKTGAVKRGLLVEPRRQRLLAFTSGAENVHTALEATYGFRSLMQIWFSCEPHKRPVGDTPRVEL